MRDYLGYRIMFGVPTPSTNTVVQPEYDAMRPHGVTNHIARMRVPDVQVNSDADMQHGIELLLGSLDDAVDSVMTCRPDHLVLGISALAVWGGSKKWADELKAKMIARAGGNIDATLATDALLAALKARGVKRRIAVVEPYYPVVQPRIESFLAEFGYEVVRFKHLKGTSFTEYTRVSAQYLVDALRSIDGDDVEALVQFGANLPMVRIADEAERWLGKPVIAINAATYWHALRSNGITDKVYGHTRLLSEF